MYAAEARPADVRRIAVIGAGWAGCAAAVELASAGIQPTLFEASRNIGGRARMVELDGITLDNGQHILLGAYASCLRLMKTVGIDPERALLRLPLQMRYPPGGMDFVAPRLPAPWHLAVALLRARGLTAADKMALARFSTTARMMDWQLNDDCTVSELLERFDQTERLTALMWRPLCIAALNTPPERASAKVFLAVLRDSLGAKRMASDMLVPRVDLSALFPVRASEYIQERGGEVLEGVPVRSIVRAAGGWQLNADRGPEAETFDAVIVAAHPAGTAALLQSVPQAEPEMAMLNDFSYEPITTCYLRYAPGTRLPYPFLALADQPDAGDFGQFVFDRGQLDARHDGLLAVVISAASPALGLGHAELGAAVARQIAAAFGEQALAQPQWTRLISEKRATFSCAPNLARPGNITAAEGLFLAGDYTIAEYPATLESAVRSGVRAAQLALGKA